MDNAAGKGGLFPVSSCLIFVAKNAGFQMAIDSLKLKKQNHYRILEQLNQKLQPLK